MTTPITPQQADREAATAALVILAEHGIAPDVGELLVFGNPSRGIAPGALVKVLAHHAQQARLEGYQQGGDDARAAIAAMIDAQHDRYHPEHAQDGKRYLCRSLASAIRKGGPAAARACEDIALKEDEEEIAFKQDIARKVREHFAHD